MRIHSVTEVKCSNSEVVKSYVLAIRNFDEQLCTKWKEGDTEICVGLKKYYPFAEIVDVSKWYPKDVITCRYLVCGASYYADCVAVFCGGVRINSGVEAIYDIEANVPKNKTGWYGICEKGITFYRRLDRAVRDKTGFYFGEVFPEEIGCKYVYYGIDCKKYRVEAKKRKRIVYFRIYEHKKKYDWTEISSLTKAELANYFSGQAKKTKDSFDLLEISGFKTWAEHNDYVSREADKSLIWP